MSKGGCIGYPLNLATSGVENTSDWSFGVVLPAAFQEKELLRDDWEQLEERVVTAVKEKLSILVVDLNPSYLTGPEKAENPPPLTSGRSGLGRNVPVWARGDTLNASKEQADLTHSNEGNVIRRTVGLDSFCCPPIPGAFHPSWCRETCEA